MPVRRSTFEHYLDRAIAAGEVSLPLSRGLADLVELRDDHLISALHAARANGGPWSRRILDREPAKLVLRERLGLDAQENLLSDALHDGLLAAGCEVFRRHSRQVFTKLASAANPDGIQLLCERRVLGRPLVENVTRHSALLTAFNTAIDLRHTYVLRQDAEKAKAVMDQLNSW